MKIVTLLENTAVGEGIHAAHGLSNYIETDKHKILFDMGPDYHFALNAEKLGIDLSQVDLAVLSHGHYDHGGGLAAFLAVNDKAPVFLRPGAFGNYYSLAGHHPQYIGLDPKLREYEERLIETEALLRFDEEITLFSDVEDTMNALAASAKLKEQVGEEWRPDIFAHEQDMIVESGGRTVLFAGCAHRGIVNIIRKAEQQMGRRPDVVFGGFHMFQLEPDAPGSDALIDEVGRQLLEGDTVYYTGHCTGEYAYQRLKTILGDRLRPMQGGRTELL